MSIGDAIAAVALLVAFSQLLSLTKKELVLHTLKQSQWLWACATAVVLFASVLPLIPGEPVPVFGYPIFWEFGGSLLLLFGIFSLVVKYNAVQSYSSKNAARLTGIATRIIARGNEQDLAELAEELAPSVPAIVQDLALYGSIRRIQARQAGTVYEMPEKSKKALGLVRILSDRQFCKAVVRREPGFLISLFKELRKRKVERTMIGSLVWEIIDQALVNEDSILRREQAFTGLGLRKEFTRAAFSDAQLNEELCPLSHWYPVLSQNLDEKTFESYCEVFLELVDAFLRGHDFYQHSLALHGPGNRIFEFATTVMSRIDTQTTETVYHSFEYKIFGRISRTLSDLICKLEASAELAESKFLEWSTSVVGTSQDYTVFKMISEWMFELIEAASLTRKFDSELRFSVIGPWLDLYPVSENSPIRIQIQRRLEVKLMDKMVDNFKSRYYPAVTRTLISLNGLTTGNQKEQPGVVFHDKVLKYISENFVELYRSDQRMALALLPIDVRFDPKKSCLVQTGYRDSVRTLNLVD